MADNDGILKSILNNEKTRSDTQNHVEKVVGNDDENLILLPLIEEIDTISDSSIKHFVRSVLLKSVNFFEPIAEGIDSELVIHTKRVYRIAKLLLAAQERDGIESDMLLAATLIQDVTKLVIIDSDGTLGIDPFHAYTVGPFVSMVRGEDDILGVSSASSSLHIDPEIMEQILRLIRCHMGIWSPVSETIPLTMLEWTLHYADYIATSLDYIITGEVID